MVKWRGLNAGSKVNFRSVSRHEAAYLDEAII